MTRSDVANAYAPDFPPDISGVDWWAMLADPAYLADPYAALKRIRDLAPVHQDPVSGIYFVLGHDAFRRMATAPEMGRDTSLWRDGWNSPENRLRDPLSFELFGEFQPQMTNANPPEHRRMRAVYEKAFREASLAWLRPAIASECADLLDSLPLDAPVDFMAAFANPLARRVTRVAFELPAEMDAQVAEWVAALSLVGNIIMSPEEKRDALSALRAFKAYLRDRLTAGIDPNGLLALAQASHADGTMDEEESLTNLVTLVSGGAATATLLGNGMLALLRHPAEFGRLRADRALVGSAVEEMLRYEPGGSFILRVAIRDYRCGDILVPAGSLAIGLVPAITRDPAQFDDPDRFDIGRRPNPHQVFGGGPHICLGKALVRMTAEAAFARLAERFGRIELACNPVWWTHRSDQHGLHSLPLRFGHA
ncbi:cytochrome P450 [Aurantimonas aggregata]|uniref:Cytochrome P450 n=1 Tax=Aurantimonas aggregata TaxID=2047720 RepID=A0A6L9MC42_9HYPH|nr:cytochrome P450 [Aurantimonas aggregata]NDV85389.1 cytochrome P450 [Aurantimonas aggregata]